MLKNNKYFKKGDIVKDSADSCWGDKLFVVNDFFGNDYLPMAETHFLGKPKSNKYAVNLDIRDMRLISCQKRPFKNMAKSVLIKLMKTNIDAKREFMIRVNNKNL